MKRTIVLLSVLVLVLLGVAGFLLIERRTEAQRTTGLQWEYAMIRVLYSVEPQDGRQNRILGVAQICYVTPTGCRDVEIRTELDYGSFMQERWLRDSVQTRANAGSRATELAYERALAQLGNDGWELTTERPSLEFTTISLEYYNQFQERPVYFQGKSTSAIYFKRPRNQK